MRACVREKRMSNDFPDYAGETRFCQFRDGPVEGFTSSGRFVAAALSWTTFRLSSLSLEHFDLFNPRRGLKLGQEDHSADYVGTS